MKKQGQGGKGQGTRAKTQAHLSSFLPIRVHSWLTLFLLFFTNFAHASEPDFGPNVLVFDPSTKHIQNYLNTIFAQQERAQFGAGRYALLFKPGKYHVDLRMGFYTQALGLGQSPDDVQIIGALRATAEWMHGNATCNFWRDAENLSVIPSDHTMIWAVSQGTALRRVHILGNLDLWDRGWSSGGFLADSKVDGLVNSGSQQQWLCRNDDLAQWQGGSLNMVFVGTDGAPRGEWPHRPFTVIPTTPTISEKPYLFIDAAGKYAVMVPSPRTNSRGINWTDNKNPGRAIPIEQFFLAHADRDNALTISAALAAGKNLILCPGIYHLDQPIRIQRPDTVILGLGYPTLVPTNATPAITVADVNGVKIAGILFDAGPRSSPALLEIGSLGDHADHGSNPTCLYDIFCRAGGATPGRVDTFITINSNNVIGDNLWLWRADHGAGAGWNENTNRQGLVINGDDVTMYGLFVEHCQGYQTLWNGERGRVYFYQSEMPYDPPSPGAWSHDGIRGFASYKVADTVHNHQAWGLGIYCVFWHAPIIADRAIEAPNSLGIQFHHMTTVRFNGHTNSGIAHILNNQGDSVITHRLARLP